MAEKDTRVSFRSAARERFQFVSSVAFSNGATLTPIKLPEVGFLNGILLVVDGTMNVGVGAALVDKGPWNLLKNINVNVNIGTSNIVSVTGFGAFLNASDLKRGFAPDGGGVFTPPSLVYSVPIASGNNTWKLVYWIPISANDSAEFSTGLINLQAPEIQCNVNITCGIANAVGDVISANAGTGFTGTISCYYQYFEVPNPMQVQWPPTQIVRTVEESTPILTTGDYTFYQILRQGYLLNSIVYLVANGSLTNAFDDAIMRINKNDVVYTFTPTGLKWRGLMANSVVLPTGCFSWSLWEALGNPSEGDTRDGFNTEAVTTLEQGYKITSGTTLGSNNNSVNTIRRVVVNLV